MPKLRWPKLDSQNLLVSSLAFCLCIYSVKFLDVKLFICALAKGNSCIKVSKKSRRGRKAKSANNGDNKQSEDQGAENKTAITHNEQSTDVDVCENSNLKTSPSGKEEISVTANADEPEPLDLNSGGFEGSMPQREDKNLNDGYSTADSSSDEQKNRIVEVDLKVSSLVSTFANNNIIQKICWLLKFYKSNATSTNHYIICILRKITEDLELSPMLYQVKI